MILKDYILSTALFFAANANAYVAGAVAAGPGDFDASLKIEFMRGVAGPENLPETEQKQKPSVNIYEANIGYNFGELAGLKDFRVGLSTALYSSKAEELNGSARYPQDSGGYVGVEVGANFIHEADRLVGFLIRNQNPVRMDIAKFVNPKIDRIAIGLVSAFKFSEKFGQEALIYIGSGVAQDGLRQNPSFSASLLSALLMHPSFLKHGLALKIGPFFDGDIAQRHDDAYGTVVRSFRVGLVGQVAAQLSPSWSVGGTYVQKFSGAYFRATRDFSFELRTAF